MYRLLHGVVLLLWASRASQLVAASEGSVNSSPLSTNTGTVSPQVTSLSTSSSSQIPSKSTSNGLCSSRTVNYITHTLPRQCLRTNRTPHNLTGAAANSTKDVANPAAIIHLPGAKPNTPKEAALPTPPSGDSSAGEVIAGSNEIVEANPTSLASTAPPPSPTDDSPTDPTPAEIETDSPLDNANFLSFEEWKKRNLEKAGQSPEDVGRSQPIDVNRQHPGINNALDTLGEENEISLDFSGFGGGLGADTPPSPGDEPTKSPSSIDAATAQQSSVSAPLSRSKDAGKTCKERTNYASFDCAASVVKTNAESKSPSSILVENKDSYMLNTCSATNKFIIVQLCDTILIDTMVLANYEFFSSSFRHFRVSVSDRYPVKMDAWKTLGTYEARNTREIQAFLVETPLIWASYLRIEFLTQYGSEYYCPVSLVRVHGTTMIQEFLVEEEIARGEVGDGEAVGEIEGMPPLPEPHEISGATGPVEKPVEETMTIAESSESVSVVSDHSAGSSATHKAVTDPTVTQDTHTSIGPTPTDSSASPGFEAAKETISTCALSDDPNTSSTPSTISESSFTKIAETKNPSTSVSSVSDPPRETPGVSTSSPLNASSTASNVTSVPSTTSNSSLPVPTDVSNSTVSVNQTSISNSTAVQSAYSVQQTNQTSTSINSTRGATSTSSGSAQPQPSTQESFFQSLHKRIQKLESNSTLSLQYIEEQSRILRDAFNKVEKRQVSSTTTFLSQLNDTVMTELHGFRQAYDQLWQSTVIELDGQREQYQREMLALSSRLTIVADELIWQKRIGIVQSTLVLMCLAMVLFGRSGNGSLEMPLMQHMVNKSSAALRGGWESPPYSVSPDNRSPVSLFRRKIWGSTSENLVIDDNAADSDLSRPASKSDSVLRDTKGLDPGEEKPIEPEQLGAGLKDNWLRTPNNSPRKKSKRPKHGSSENLRNRSPLAPS